ncbi:MAG: MBL fold metallo-hydrolase [Clostridia bacterium]|nr:MBL fold metallo-hydrolase [Clostridia bacterium]
MVTFSSLISGSSGNSTLISDGRTHILTDCGMSGSKLKDALSAFGISPDNLSAILVTHEHIDHVRGVGVVARRYGTPIYATEKTIKNLNCGNIDDSLIHTITPDADFEIGTFGIRPFSIPHDAADPVGYSYFSQDEKFSLATDIGHMNDYILSNIMGSSRILLESNHDVDMLQFGTYPFPLKQRILSDVGHLSNENAAMTAYKLIQSGTKSIALGHLSNENNTPEIAHLETFNYLTQKGVSVGDDVRLQVAKRYGVTNI